MTARMNTGALGAMIDPAGRAVSGNALATSDHGDLRKLEPGTLWERVAEGHAVYRSPRPYSAVDKVQLAARLERVSSESIPERTERIARDRHITRREALRVAFAESRLEEKKRARRATSFARLRELEEEMDEPETPLARAKAAHPAGKGIKQEEGQA